MPIIELQVVCTKSVLDLEPAHVLLERLELALLAPKLGADLEHLRLGRSGVVEADLWCCGLFNEWRGEQNSRVERDEERTETNSW